MGLFFSLASANIEITVLANKVPQVGATVSGIAYDGAIQHNLSDQMTNSKGVATFTIGWPYTGKFTATLNGQVGTTQVSAPLLGKASGEIDVIFSPISDINQTLSLDASKASNAIFGVVITIGIVAGVIYLIKKLLPMAKTAIPGIGELKVFDIVRKYLR